MTQQICSQWKRENKDIGGSFVEDLLVLMQIIDQIIKADEEVFFESESLWLCLSSVPR